MVPSRRGAVLLLLGAVLVGPGCLGIVTDSAPPSPTAGPDGPGSDRAVLTFVVDLTRASAAPTQLTAVELAGLADGQQLVAQPTRIGPGQHRAVAALASDTGESVGPLALTLLLDDGLGPARLLLTGAGWDAASDGLVTLTLTLVRPGELVLEAIDGPVVFTARNEHAVPTYGLLVWDASDRSQVLDGFPHRIVVPQGFPQFVRGQSLRFAVEGARVPVTWTLDGHEAGTGREHRLVARPGVHELSVSVGSGPSYLLTLRVDDRLHLEGTAPPPLDDPLVPRILEPQGEHRIDVLDGAWRVAIQVESDPATGLVPELELLGPSGDRIARSGGEEEGHATLEVTGELAPGAYLLRVRSGDGVPLDYTGAVSVRY